MLLYPDHPVLIVDDEPEILTGFQFTLGSQGINHVKTFSNPLEVLPYLAEQQAGVILLDLSMPGMSGEELLKRLQSEHPHIKVIVVTGFNEVDTAVECMKAGAFDYLVKPVEKQRLVSSTKRAIDLWEEQREYREFRQRVMKNKLAHPEVFDGIITRNNAMRTIFQYIETVATTRKPVLITGESGVGKGLFADALHRLSGVKGECIHVNVAGLDDTLFADTLYGHVKGAFTGATENRTGLVEQAANGTLFLDEIGDLSLQSQVKLLQLLEEGIFYPVGSDIAKTAQVRIVTATNKSVEDLQSGSAFRSDLFYRLQTHHIEVPPLRDRLDDLPVLLDYFLEQAAHSLNKKKPTPPRELFQLLASYSFPGNVRELQSMVFDAISHHQSRMLSMERFRSHIERQGGVVQKQSESEASAVTLFEAFPELPTLKQARQQLIAEALRRASNNSAAAASILGISRSGLNKILQREQGEE